MLKNVTELLSILHKNRNFISAIFESSNRQMNINSAAGMIDPAALESLESLNIIDIYDNEVLLNEYLASFLESYLIDGYDADLLNYTEIFKKIDTSVQLFFKSREEGNNTDKYTRDIHRTLRKIPTNLMDWLKGIQRRVEFTYKTAPNAKIKLLELRGYRESLERFDTTLAYIRNELRKMNGFFALAGDTSIELQRIRISELIQDIYDSLIRINKVVMEYIANAEANKRFHEHIVMLKDLRDRKELIDKTNLYELLSESKGIFASGFTSIEKKNYTIKLYPDFAFEEEFLERAKKAQCNIPHVESIQADMTPIDDEFLSMDTMPIANYDGLLYEYLENDPIDITLLTYLKENMENMDDRELLGIYLDMIISNADHLDFIENKFERINDYDCISVKSKALSSI